MTKVSFCSIDLANFGLGQKSNLALPEISYSLIQLNAETQIFRPDYFNLVSCH